MGSLHDGHLSLIEEARRECSHVVMSLYINALQFGDIEDFERYPRDLERDLRLAASAGADLVFVPEDSTMYPEGDVSRVSFKGISEIMEGSFRPGHFEGVGTVVVKLLAGLQPDRAYFGRKDAQQLAVVRRLVRDLAFPIRIVGCPTVREKDGLALSSRNLRLDPKCRESALALSRGLFEAADLAESGEIDGPILERTAMNVMADTLGVEPEYATLADQINAVRISHVDRPAFLAVAARIGRVRLIDNIHLELVERSVVVDRGLRLSHKSVLYDDAMQQDGSLENRRVS